MDLIIQGNQAKLFELLISLGFKIKRHKSYHEARLDQPEGRLHLLITKVAPGKIYSDVHFDRVFHFLGLGVDYRTRPLNFYEKVLLRRLRSNGFQSEVVGGFDWSTRRNKAIISGLRLR